MSDRQSIIEKLTQSLSDKNREAMKLILAGTPTEKLEMCFEMYVDRLIKFSQRLDSGTLTSDV